MKVFNLFARACSQNQEASVSETITPGSTTSEASTSPQPSAVEPIQSQPQSQSQPQPQSQPQQQPQSQPHTQAQPQPPQQSQTQPAQQPVAVSQSQPQTQPVASQPVVETHGVYVPGMREVVVPEKKEAAPDPSLLAPSTLADCNLCSTKSGAAKMLEVIDKIRAVVAAFRTDIDVLSGRAPAAYTSYYKQTRNILQCLNQVKLV